jgi:hypothetical protein
MRHPEPISSDPRISLCAHAGYLLYRGVYSQREAIAPSTASVGRVFFNPPFPARWQVKENPPYASFHFR